MKKLVSQYANNPDFDEEFESEQRLHRGGRRDEYSRRDRKRDKRSPRQKSRKFRGTFEDKEFFK